jgi:peptide/nickel transport system substrate-binding protein
MQAVAGTDPAGWRDRIGLFGPEAPLANDAGIAVFDEPRDYAAVRRELTAAGYHGERIVALDTADISVIHALTLVGVDALHRSGMDVDVQSMDFGTMVRRRGSKQPIDASDLDAEKRICRELQLQLWRDVPYIPMGQYSQQTCYRRTLTDVRQSAPLFFGVRPA